MVGEAGAGEEAQSHPQAVGVAGEEAEEVQLLQVEGEVGVGAAGAEVRPLAAARGDLEAVAAAAVEQRPGEKEEREEVVDRSLGGQVEVEVVLEYCERVVVWAAQEMRGATVQPVQEGERRG